VRRQKTRRRGSDPPPDPAPPARPATPSPGISDLSPTRRRVAAGVIARLRGADGVDDAATTSVPAPLPGLARAVVPMGARGLAALVVLLLAAALLPNTASGSDRRILEGGKPSSGEHAPAPTGAAGGSPKGDPPKESGHSSAAGQTSESHKHQKPPPPAPSPPNDTKVPSAEQGKEGGEVQASVSPPPPSPVKETDSHKDPPPGGPGSNGEGEVNGGTNPEDTGSQVNKEEMNKMKEVMEKCDASHKCSSGKEFSACLVSDNGNALSPTGNSVL